jgi:hypothetical protein
MLLNSVITLARSGIAVCGSTLLVRSWSRRTAGIVKGFRTPARHRRGQAHEGRRPKSLEGGNRGGSSHDADVDLWGICRRCLMVVAVRRAAADGIPFGQASPASSGPTLLVPSARAQHDANHREHNRHFDENTDNSRERRTGLEPEQRDRGGNGELEEV